jgi:hypothetical protein
MPLNTAATSIFTPLRAGPNFTLDARSLTMRASLTNARASLGVAPTNPSWAAAPSPNAPVIAPRSARFGCLRSKVE